MSEKMNKLKIYNLDYMKELYRQEMLKRRWTERTIDEYLRDLTQFLNFIKKSSKITDVKEITRKEVSNYQNYLFYYTGKDDKRYSINTQLKKLSVVISFFDFLVITNRIVINPTKGIILPKEEKKLPKKPFSEEELKRLFEAIDTNTLLGFRDRVIFELFYTTGIRVTELINLRIEDVNLEERILRIAKGKGNKPRLVPLCKIMVEYMKEYIEEVRPLFLRDKESSYLFITVKGKGFTHRNEIQMILKKYSNKAGIKRKIGTHHFRASCATRMMEGGASIRHIQEMLGHDKLETTERYLKVSIKSLKAEHERRHPREEGR